MNLHNTACYLIEQDILSCTELSNTSWIKDRLAYKFLADNRGGFSTKTISGIKSTYLDIIQKVFLKRQENFYPMYPSYRKSLYGPFEPFISDEERIVVMKESIKRVCI